MKKKATHKEAIKIGLRNALEFFIGISYVGFSIYGLLELAWNEYAIWKIILYFATCISIVVFVVYVEDNRE